MCLSAWSLGHNLINTKHTLQNPRQLPETTVNSA